MVEPGPARKKPPWPGSPVVRLCGVSWVYFPSEVTPGGRTTRLGVRSAVAGGISCWSVGRPAAIITVRVVCHKHKAHTAAICRVAERKLSPPARSRAYHKTKLTPTNIPGLLTRSSTVVLRPSCGVAGGGSCTHVPLDPS